MSEEEGKKEGGGEAAAPKSKKKLIIIIAVVLVLVLGGAAAALLLGGKKEEVKGEEKEVEEERVLATAELPTIIVNLSESTSFLKVTMLLEYDLTAIHRIEAAHSTGEKGAGSGGGHAGGGEAKAGGLPGPLMAREPMIKDVIIKVLSSRKAEDVLTADGKEKLKEELIEAINEASALDEPVIVAVYFLEFIIQ